VIVLDVDFFFALQKQNQVRTVRTFLMYFIEIDFVKQA